tara:strand:- start:442 stop:1251 length:810 start_codon:yes stop_codon:yes gene_type:complete
VTIKSTDNLHFIKWPATHVLAFNTTRLPSSNYLSTKSSANLLSNAANTEQLQSAFDYFNLGSHVGDCPDSVARNRQSLLQYLPNKIKIQWLEQVHGSNVVDVIKHNTTPMVADAAITRCQNIALAVMTADCLPILLSNREGSEIAAIHAGWRPLAASIISSTLTKMKSENKDIHAWLGPCIGVEHFEVGAEVKQAFSDISPILSGFFINSSFDKFQADLVGLATYLLEQAGVVSITHQQACTFTESNKYYSYRRENKTGRMASIICFNR